MFCHFSKRRWTLEIIFFDKSVLFCVLHPILAEITSLLNFFDFQLTLLYTLYHNAHSIIIRTKKFSLILTHMNYLGISMK